MKKESEAAVEKVTGAITDHAPTLIITPNASYRAWRVVVSASVLLLGVGSIISAFVDIRQDAALRDMTMITINQSIRIQALEARITTLSAQIDITRAEANARDGL